MAPQSSHHAFNKAQAVKQHPSTTCLLFSRNSAATKLKTVDLMRCWRKKIHDDVIMQCFPTAIAVALDGRRHDTRQRKPLMPSTPYLLASKRQGCKCCKGGNFEPENDQGKSGPQLFILTKLEHLRIPS